MSNFTHNLTANSIAWHQLARESRLNDYQIKGLAFYFACINANHDSYIENKKHIAWLINSDDYKAENNTMLLDRYSKVDEIAVLGILALINELIFKCGYDLKEDRVNSKNDIPYVIFKSKDDIFLPVIDKENYNYSLRDAHNLYEVFLGKTGALLDVNTYTEAYDLGMLYSYSWNESDPSGFHYFFSNFYNNAPPIFKSLWTILILDRQVSAGKNKHKKYTPFQLALYFLISPLGDDVAEYIWVAASFLFYKNQQLVNENLQWTSTIDFFKQALTAIEKNYERILQSRNEVYLQNIQNSIEDKFIFNHKNKLDKDALLVFYETCLYEDYKYSLDESNVNESSALQQKACIFVTAALLKTKNLLMFSSPSNQLQ
jgi:hypothetical protein